MVRAFHLPALPSLRVAEHEFGAEGRPTLLGVPQLTDADLDAQVDALLQARDRFLADRPVADIVAVVDRVARRFLDPSDPVRLRAEELLPAITSTSGEMVRLVLDRMAADWRAPALEGLLVAEFGEFRVLDRFVEAPGRPGRSRALGPPLLTHIFSGNVPGVAVTSLIRALLVKSASLGKTAAGEPLLPVLFAEAVAEEDRGIGQCLAVTYWPGGEQALEAVALGRAGAVIAYGGARALQSLRERTPPGTRFHGYGHHLSFGIVAREALHVADAADLAARAALDAATFDQQGCVSPHLFYVEEGGAVTPRDWARLLAAAMGRLEERLPRGPIPASDAATIRQMRGEMEFAEISGSGAELHASEGSTVWTVAFDPDPAFAASCLNRVVWVKPIAEVGEVEALVQRYGQLLQTVGCAGDAERLEHVVEAVARLGATRIAPIGSMAWPPATWHHDGRPALGDLVRWADWES